MDKVYQQENYLEIKKWVDQAVKNKYSIGIVALDGFGVSFMLKALVKKNNKIKYLSKNDLELAEFNIIDLDLDDDNIKTINDLFRKADIDQKFCVVIQKPYLLNNPDFKNNYFYSKIYKFFYLKVYNANDCKFLCENLQIKLNDSVFNEIYEKSFGVGKLFKYLAVNWPDYEGEKWEEVKKEVFAEAGKCDLNQLERMGLSKPEIGLSKKENFDIEIDFDLSFWEKSRQAKEKLGKEERDILVYMIENNGQITREKVADFRWGEGKYDEFSDQAINQAMRRLDKKLNLYKIRTIPKVGYVLENR